MRYTEYTILCDNCNEEYKLIVDADLEYDPEYCPLCGYKDESSMELEENE